MNPASTHLPRGGRRQHAIDPPLALRSLAAHGSGRALKRIAVPSQITGYSRQNLREQPTPRWTRRLVHDRDEIGDLVRSPRPSVAAPGRRPGDDPEHADRDGGVECLRGTHAWLLQRSATRQRRNNVNRTASWRPLRSATVLLCGIRQLLRTRSAFVGRIPGRARSSTRTFMFCVQAGESSSISASSTLPPARSRFSCARARRTVFAWASDSSRCCCASGTAYPTEPSIWIWISRFI